MHIIRAQTGMGKTNLYLDYLNKTDRKFLIAVPTHQLKMEVYNKALSKGVILVSEGYQRYDYRNIEKVEMTDDIFKALENIEGNILDLAESCYVFKGESDTIFLKRKWLPCSKAIIMSATANEDVYRMFAH